MDIPRHDPHGYSQDKWEPDYDIIISLNAYGTLVKGKDVCASYAEVLAFYWLIQGLNQLILMLL